MVTTELANIFPALTMSLGLQAFCLSSHLVLSRMKLGLRSICHFVEKGHKNDVNHEVTPLRDRCMSLEHIGECPGWIQRLVILPKLVGSAHLTTPGDPQAKCMG